MVDWGMLGRASRSRLPPITPNQKYLQKSYNELYLPWLCPSLHSRSPHSRPSTTVAPLRAKTSSRPAKLGPVKKHEAIPSSPRRGLASAVTESYLEPSEDYIPFANGSSFLGSAPKLFLDDSAPLIIDGSCISAPATFRSFNGISGELEQIHQTLHACLQVGRLQRAEALVRRLNQLYKPTAPGLLAAHNEYLRELSWRITKDRDPHMLKGLHRWYERNVRGKGVPSDATTYALMIQASLSEVDPKKLARTINRYLGLAEESGIHDETLRTTLAFIGEEEADKLTSITASPQQIEAEVEIPPHPDVPHTVTTSMPEIKSVQQKGQGLAALRRSLSMFTESTSVSPTEEVRNETSSSITSQDELRQRRLEKDTYEAAISRWREENAQQKKIGIDASLSNNSIGALMWAWHEALVPLIKEEVQKANEAEDRTVKSTSDKERCQYGPFLRLLPPEKISAATILTTMTMLSCDAKLEDGVKLAGLVVKIGSNVQDESLVETVRVQAQRRMKEPQLSRRVTRARTAVTKYPSSRYSYARLLDPGERTSELVEGLKWTGSILAKIGSVLLSQLMEVAKVDIVSTRAEKPVTMERQPVFFHTFRYVDGKRQGIVRLNKAMFEKLSREPVKSVLSKNLPMIVRPRPWTGFREGGFLEHHIPVVRIQGGLERRYAITASDNGDMDQTFGGLTVLGKTPWQINRPVLETMLEAWNTGEAIAKIPPLNPYVEPPPEPSKTLVDYPAQRLTWLKQLKTIENFKSGLRSVRCYQNFQLEIARAYIDETFYFPHNLDFRGRAYPISPLFNHMCSDNVRGLLIFAEGKELGEAGLRWLKIHLANVYGFDKASFAERENFATDHLSDIYDSVESPLNGKRWWLKAEDPWQCLATCIELKNAFESEDPHRFVSHLPVHQDGTCNGLQHYAALGGDSLGAKQVNLEPGDRPSDIYTAVSELVKMEVTKDSAQGNKVAQALEGKVTRKLVKQTVMTNVYGVTFIGAQRQVRRQLTEIFSAGRTVGSIGLKEMATYIATKIFSALSTMFNGAHDIQYWLGNCASRISESLAPEQIDLMLDGDRDKHKNADYKRVPSVRQSIEGPTAFKTPVIWTNPMGMPVVQPYRQATAQRVSTNLQTVSIKAHSGADPVSKRKQFQAFPPNFIHSLDASHMVLTALKCDEIGLTFAAVHDSFWTHATDVNSMNGIIRDSFIRMHSENIMDRLAAEFSARYKDYIYLASVKASSAVGRKIKALRKPMGTNAVRKLSNAAQLVELRAERLRCKLLASNDADERDRGASMVTAASIFEEAADEKELLPRQSPGTSLGEVLSARSTKLEANEQLEVGDVDNTKLLDAATEDFDLDVTEHLEDSLSVMLDRTSEAEDEKAKPSKTKKQQQQERRVRFWMPLTFPPVPKKGDFDVSRLKSSPYFFC